ncbi:fimbrial protein [Escherichia coli]|uniref:fimbrial protein n=1 Tax=Escherichia coli TaxID=562 RepID=UPI00311AEEEE
MKYCLNSLCFLFFAPVMAIGAEEVSQSVNMDFTVNIEPPVCKLNNANLSIDFDEFQLFDILAGNVKKAAVFAFTDCTNVNSVTISFSGNNVDDNFIKNKSGDTYASGVAIRLYNNDNGNLIQLKDKQIISINNAESFNFGVIAEVQKENNSAKVTPGNIDTSVDLNITYN